MTGTNYIKQLSKNRQVQCGCGEWFSCVSQWRRHRSDKLMFLSWPKWWQVGWLRLAIENHNAKALRENKKHSVYSFTVNPT